MDNINILTGIYMCTNVDGVHVKEELIGYIDQHPFIVLEELIAEYYIYGYDKDILYPAHMVGYNHFLYIKNEGYSYSYKNYNKPKIKDISVFTELFSEELRDAEIIGEYSEEYLTMLENCVNSNQNIQYALDIKTDDYSSINESDFRVYLIEYYKAFLKCFDINMLHSITPNGSDIDENELKGDYSNEE